MSEQTKRFRPSVVHDRESGLTFGRMEESLTGGYVFFEDYDTLRRQLAEAEDKLSDANESWDLCKQLQLNAEAKLALAEQDSKRLDALEYGVNELGALLLHNGLPNYHGFSGLGLRNTGRTLRQAVDEYAAIPAMEAAWKEPAARCSLYRVLPYGTNGWRYAVVRGNQTDFLTADFTDQAEAQEYAAHRNALIDQRGDDSLPAAIAAGEGE